MTAGRNNFVPVVVIVAAAVVSCFAVGISRAAAVQAQPDTGCPDSSTTLPTPGGGNLTIRCKWEVFVDGHVDQSSPEIATLDGDVPSILVGTRDTGLVYAVQLSDGQTVSGWPVATGSAVDSSPTADPRLGRRPDDVVVDSGDVVTVPPGIARRRPRSDSRSSHLTGEPSGSAGSRTSSTRPSAPILRSTRRPPSPT